jgi:hypothetical protein
VQGHSIAGRYGILAAVPGAGSPTSPSLALAVAAFVGIIQANVGGLVKPNDTVTLLTFEAGTYFVSLISLPVVVITGVGGRAARAAAAAVAHAA